MYPNTMRSFLILTQRVLHMVSLYLLAGAALAAVIYTLACAVGQAPWLDVTIRFGDAVYAGAGMAIQLGLTLILAALVFFMPSANRIMALENSHRRFHMSMEDVARAYHAAHAADRAGMFTMSSEFDQVRERLAFMREHPDLSALEPDVLEVAAQMSQQSRELADVYSDEKVARAKAFLKQRQEEAEAHQEQITQALFDISAIRQWRAQVEVEESVVASQLEQLKEQLDLALPPLGLRVIETPTRTKVVALPEQTAAE